MQWPNVSGTTSAADASIRTLSGGRLRGEMKLYKLTDQDGQTQGNTQWGEGVTHSLTTCPNPKLCSGDVLHAYTNINLALLLNPVHANISSPLLWECEGDITVQDWGKVGCFELTTTHRLPLPGWYMSVRNRVVVRFSILCARAVLHYYEEWAPTDKRVREAIEAAEEYLNNPSARAAYAAAADAARAAARAAAAAAAAAAADAAADAARARAAYAYAAADARAAYADAARARVLHFSSLADEAVRMETEGR